MTRLSLVVVVLLHLSVVANALHTATLLPRRAVSTGDAFQYIPQRGLLCFTLYFVSNSFREPRYRSHVYLRVGSGGFIELLLSTLPNVVFCRHLRDLRGMPVVEILLLVVPTAIFFLLSNSSLG